MGKILAIDLGTTYFKLSLFDRGGNLLEVARITPSITTTDDGRMELTANDCIAAIELGIIELKRSGKSLAEVEAVTYATQTNSFALFDAGGNPLTPLILWPDRRAADFEGEVKNRSGISGFTAVTGIPAMGYQFMLAKILWLREKQPEIWKKTVKIRLISDFMTHLFTGKYATEASASGLTGLLDIHRCQWWPKMLDRFEIGERMLSTVVRAGTDLGPVDAETAKQFGLPPRCRFIVGCLDQYAGAIGAGNIVPGMISETTGTVLATVRCADRFADGLGPNVFQGPAFQEDIYWRMAFGDVSANYLQWYRDQLPDRPDFDKLTALAERIEPGAEGLRLRTGAILTDPQSVFEGLSPRHSTGHHVRCIMEAVAFALNGQIAELSDGSPAREVRCAGGAARSELWLQIKADLLGVETVATICPEPTSLGAAMLAEAALAKTSLQEVARRWVQLKPPHRPNRQCHLRYRAIFENK